MAENTEAADRVDTSAGHLSMRIDGRPETNFQFSQQPKRLAMTFLSTLLMEVAVVASLYVAGKAALEATGIIQPAEPPIDVVFLANQPGPGGGGGGGGNRMPDPPKKAEAPGKDKITVPAAPPELIQAKLEPPPIDTINVPVQSLSSGLDSAIGVVQAPAGPPTLSQGSGSGGGAGTGRGTGIGSGTGSGLGPGTGGGTGGGAYRPGSGVSNPSVITRVDPVYTPDAAERRIEGEVWVECIVNTSGVCTETHVTKSLDSRYGLDQAAVKAAQGWRFRPGMKGGTPVPVIITIAIEFSIR